MYFLKVIFHSTRVREPTPTAVMQPHTITRIVFWVFSVSFWCLLHFSSYLLHIIVLFSPPITKYLSSENITLLQSSKLQFLWAWANFIILTPFLRHTVSDFLIHHLTIPRALIFRRIVDKLTVLSVCWLKNCQIYRRFAFLWTLRSSERRLLSRVVHWGSRSLLFLFFIVPDSLYRFKNLYVV